MCIILAGREVPKLDNGQAVFLRFSLHFFAKFEDNLLKWAYDGLQNVFLSKALGNVYRRDRKHYV